MLSGSRNYYINGKFEFSLHDGDLIFIPSGACYSSKVEECDTAEGIYVDFNLTLGGKPFYLDESFRRFTADRVQKERFMRLAESSGVRLLAKAELLYILSDISAKEENLRFEGGEFSRIRNAALGIERHPERPVDVGLSRGSAVFPRQGSASFSGDTLAGSRRLSTGTGCGLRGRTSFCYPER